jgi:cytochrome c oxidase subunit 2
MTQAAEGNLILPPRASTIAADVDHLFWYITAVSVFFFVLILILLLWFSWKHRQTDKSVVKHGSHHNTLVEVGWSLPPVLLVLSFAIWGFRGYMESQVPPTDAYEIEVVAFQWGWGFRYPNGYQDQNLHIPADRPVRLILTSNDVIHSLYIPAFRLKKDCVPGRFNSFWFDAPWSDDRDFVETISAIDPDTGEDQTFTVNRYPLYCTEYCGTSHSQMSWRGLVDPETGDVGEEFDQRGYEVVVHEPGDFDRWLGLASQWLTTIPPADAGRRLWSANCAACHSIDGSPGTGPTWQNLWGAQRNLPDGTITVEGDAGEAYITESVWYPNAYIVPGNWGQMNSYLGQIDEREMFAMIQFMKTIAPDTFPQGADINSWEESPYAVGSPTDAEPAADDPAGADAPGPQPEQEQAAPGDPEGAINPAGLTDDSPIPAVGQ